VTVTKNSNSQATYNPTNSFQANGGDSITVFLQNYTPTGSGCGEATTTTEIQTGNIFGGMFTRRVLNTSTSSDTYTFSPVQNTEDGIVIRFPAA